MNYEYERVPTPASGLRLHLNENTAGCSPRVLAAIHAMTREQAAWYPDYDAPVAAAASRLGVSTGELLLTNGLDEGILLVSLAALRGGSAEDPYEAVVVQPAFDMYAACADAVGGKVIEVQPEPDFAFPGDAVFRAIGVKTRVVFLTHPNNPTGLPLDRETILRIAEHAPAVLVFVDEAYIDFGAETLIGDRVLARLPNVIVGRTFAKAYGLAGLRAGALIGSEETLAGLRRIAPPYSLNVAAAAALPAAFADTAYYDWYVAQVRESRALLYGALERHRIKHWRSAANFVLACFGADAGRVAAELAARGIIVRDRSRDPGCAGCLRITSGVLEHTRACVDALEEVLCAGR
jgi:histidinol-phosphate aminotransferase